MNCLQSVDFNKRCKDFISISFNPILMILVLETHCVWSIFRLNILVEFTEGNRVEVMMDEVF